MSRANGVGMSICGVTERLKGGGRLFCRCEYAAKGGRGRC